MNALRGSPSARTGARAGGPGGPYHTTCCLRCCCWGRGAGLRGPWEELAVLCAPAGCPLPERAGAGVRSDGPAAPCMSASLYFRALSEAVDYAMMCDLRSVLWGEKVAPHLLDPVVAGQDAGGWCGLVPRLLCGPRHKEGLALHEGLVILQDCVARRRLHMPPQRLAVCVNVSAHIVKGF